MSENDSAMDQEKKWTPELAAAKLWESELKELAAKAAKDPYIEDLDLNLDDNLEIATEALSNNFHDCVQATIDMNIDYVASQRDASLESLFNDAIGWRGSLAEAYEAIEDECREADDDFDEDDFKDATREQFMELARDEGFDCLFDVQPRFRGRAAGLHRIDFSLHCGPEEPCEGPMIPVWTEESACEWRDLLSSFNIDPLEFAKAVAANAKAALEDKELMAKYAAEAGCSKTELARQIRSALASQGLSGNIASSPSKWTGGLGLLAKAYGKIGQQPKGGAPLFDAAQLVEIIEREEGELEIEVEFEVAGEELQSHSEFIGRHGPQAPLCCDATIHRLAIVEAPRLFINSREVQTSGNYRIEAGEIKLSSPYGRMDSSFSTLAEKSRMAAVKASNLAWGARYAGEALGAAEPAENEAARIKEFYDDLDKLPQTAERRSILEAALHMAARFENASSAAPAIQARIAKAPFDAKAPLGIEDFELLKSLETPLWRHEAAAAIPKLTEAIDSIGNNILHKLIAMWEPDLAAIALAAAPGLADKPNAFGTRPLDLAMTVNSSSVYVQIAKAIIEARPDLADAAANSIGGSLIWGALEKTSLATPEAIEDIKSLLRAGCRIDQPADRDGDRPWLILMGKPALRRDGGERILSELIAECGDRFDPNSRGRDGSTMAHRACTIGQAQVLAKANVDFSIENDKGKAGGCLMTPEDFAQFEKLLIQQEAPCEEPARRAMSL